MKIVDPATMQLEGVVNQAESDQIRIGQQVKVATLAIVKGETPTQIAKRAMSEARIAGYDVVMLDTAGRLHIDEELLADLAVRDQVGFTSLAKRAQAALAG